VKPCVDLWVERDAFFGQGDIDLATVFRIAHSADDALGFQQSKRRDSGPGSIPASWQNSLTASAPLRIAPMHIFQFFTYWHGSKKMPIGNIFVEGMHYICLVTDNQMGFERAMS
jgi:hypothetical protein